MKAGLEKLEAENKTLMAENEALKVKLNAVFVPASQEF
jgi:hypothetical protein